jgi:hypothetical protein
VVTGGTVNVLQGTYAENVTVSRQMTIDGADRDATIIDAAVTAMRASALPSTIPAT